MMMIALYPKRLYTRSGLNYDIAAHTIPLLLNLGGWNFLSKLITSMGLRC